MAEKKTPSPIATLCARDGAGRSTPRVLSYFEALESKYGIHFTFDGLTLAELKTLERFTAEAVLSDHGLDADDQRNLGVLLKLIRDQLSYRRRSQWVTRPTGTDR